MSVGGAAGGGLLAGKAKILIAALVVVGGGGAAYVATGGEVPFVSGSSDMIDTVPADVDMVMYMDPSVADDGATKTLIEELGKIAEEQAPTGDTPSDSGDLKSEFESETGLDYGNLNGVVMYATYPEDSAGGPTSGLSQADYTGVIIDSDWATEDLMAAAENETVYEEGEYEGYTVYQQKPTEDETPDYLQDTENPTWVGVVGDGTYVVGTEDAVKDALDVDAGNADAFGGDLRTAYDETRDGYVKFASRVPEEQVGSGASAGGASQTAQNIDIMTGAYYTKGGDTIGMQTRMLTGGSDDAENLKKQIDGGLATVEESGMASEEVTALIDDVEVSQDGSTVVVTFESKATDIASAVEAAVQSFMGGSSYDLGTARPVAPA